MGRPAPQQRAGVASDEQELGYYAAKAAFVKAFSKAPHPPSARAPQPPGAVRGATVRQPTTNSSSRSNDPLEASLIAPGLFLGSCEVERSADLIARLSISHVLQVGTELAPSHLAAGISYLSLPIFDIEEEDIIALLPACLGFLEQALSSGGVVLVHCVAGVSRSAAVVVAHIMWTQGVAFAEARAIVKAARPRVNLNLGFTLQLQLFEKLGLSGLVQWGVTASLPAALGSCWAPWGLERFLQVKAQVADDRTVQGGGGGSGTAAAALELEELEPEQKEGPGQGAGTAPLAPGSPGPNALEAEVACAEDGGLLYCSALEVAVRAGRIAWSDYYLGEAGLGEREGEGHSGAAGPSAGGTPLPRMGCGEGEAGPAWFPNQEQHWQRVAQSSVAAAGAPGAGAAAVHAPASPASGCGSPQRWVCPEEPRGASMAFSTLAGGGGGASIASVPAAAAAAAEEGEDWWLAAFAPSLSPPARPAVALPLDSKAGCEQGEGEGRPLLSRAPACLPLSPPATPPHFRPSAPGQEAGPLGPEGSLYEYAVALQQAARGGGPRLPSPRGGGQRQRCELPAAVSALCGSPRSPGLVLPPVAGAGELPGSRPDSAGWPAKQQQQQQQQRPGTAQSVLSSLSFGSGRSSLSVMAAAGGAGPGLGLTRSDSCMSSASSCATLPSVRSSASSACGGGGWGQEAAAEAAGAGAGAALGRKGAAVPVMPLLLPRIGADRGWGSGPASACASPHSPLASRACSSSRLGSPCWSPGPGGRQAQALALAGGVGSSRQLQLAAAELCVQQQRPGSPSSLSSRLDR